ncbi:MAG TPA: YtxH domain-containing protein [Thermomicrobiales bacterium]|nr:YtxH domain-containing protein [Thermomicrobiales bacterium]
MFGHTRTAVKFFVYGLIVGLLFAPRSGDETRKELFNRVRGMIGGGL